MNCAEVRERLWLYLYAELSAEEQAAVAAHLTTCTACTASLTEEEQLHALLRQRPLPEASPQLLAECRVRLGEKLAEEALGWRWFQTVPTLSLSRGVTVLALLVLGFSAGWLARPRAEQFSPGRSTQPAVSPFVAADLSGVRISGISQVVTDPETGLVRLTVDAERRLAVEGTVDDPNIQHLLVAVVKGYENAGIRRESLEALRVRPQNPEIRAALIHALLRDHNLGVRLEALEALRGLAWDAAARQAFVQVLERDLNPGIRVAAINVLAEHADAELLPLLRELARKDHNAYVRWKCASALRGIEEEF